jgi:prepilin-type N-terminal cleavage/methylation domain-containing protein
MKYKYAARSNHQAGYTLIELLMYISIVGTLLTGAALFMSTMTEARVKNQSISEVNEQGMLAMEQMTRIIRNADSITAPAAGSSANQLTLAVPTGSLSPTILNLSTNTLQIKEGAATAVALTNSKVQVTTLSFKNVTRTSTPGAIQITMTLARVNTLNRNEYDYQKTFVTTAALRWP